MEENKILEIITAIGDSNLNDVLKLEKDFEILENDIYYKEGIIEYLEKNNQVDILIFYEKLNGQINNIELINEIKKINNNIKIIYFIENKNIEKENNLKNIGIKNIYYLDEIDINNFIEEIKNIYLNNNENVNKEILKLKEIIKEKNEEILKIKNINNNYYYILGEEKVGKTLVINNFLKCNEYSNIEFIEIKITNNLNNFKINLEKEKIVFIIEAELKKIIYSKKIINKLINNKIIIKNNIKIIINKFNKYSVNKKIIKNIFRELNLIGIINYNYYCEIKDNKKNNILNKKYKKILKKLKENKNGISTRFKY